VQPAHVGEYQLIATLGRGGMVDVYLATRRGPVGFAKLVVIERHAKLELFGFSDAVGAAAANVKLSRDRAQTIARELAARGVAVDVVEGFGEAMPVAPAADADRNRRVEVWLRTGA
jgi:outer membrane protein OmpA-like peptidoglycan-associated protein